MCRSFQWAIVLLFASVIPSAALAQAHRWAVVYSGSSEPQSSHIQAISRLSAALSRYGEVVSPANAAGLFEGAYSRPVHAVTADQEAELNEALRTMDAQVGRRQRSAALRTAARIQALIDQSFEAWLTRQELAARLFHTCLIVAGLRGHDDAIRHLNYCRMIDPTTVPDPALYPVEVSDRLSEFDAEFRGRSMESLSVDADVPGQLVLDGRLIGATPQTLAVRTGEHRVVLDTGELSRYYRVHVAPGMPEALHVDTLFDRSIRSGGTLSLVYRSTDEEQENRQQHGLLLARVLGVTDLVLATPREDALRIDRLGTDGTVKCSVIVRLDDGRSDRRRFQRAAQALVTSESIDLGTLEPIERWHPPALPAAAEATAVAAAEPGAPNVAAQTESSIPLPAVTVHEVPRPASAPPMTTRMPTLPVALSIGGGALVLVSVGILSYSIAEESRYGRLDSTEEGFLDSQRQISMARALFMSLAVGGSILTASGLPWILPRQRRVPWWAWASLGVGAGMLVPSIWALAAPGACIDRYCLMGTERDWLGLSLLSYSLAILTIPTIFLLRDRLRLDVTVIPNATHAGMAMLVWLRF